MAFNLRGVEEVGILGDCNFSSSKNEAPFFPGFQAVGDTFA